MSFIDKVIRSATPPADGHLRGAARQRAEGLAVPGDWLTRVIYHHRLIETAFEQVQRASEPMRGRREQQRLSILLTGHANAEEAVLYPALARIGARGHAANAYSEQAEARMQLAELQLLSPLSREHLDKLLQMRNAITQHMYEEEARWFLQLRSEISGVEEVGLTQRYQREFDRYVGAGRWLGRDPLALEQHPSGVRRAAPRSHH